MTRKAIQDSATPGRNYEVGYGKPPAKHRFCKGQSGNPRGRPKGAKNKVQTRSGLSFGDQPANQMLLEEAYRIVTVREGDQLIQLPAIKAVFRAMGVSAMKGNRLAQATMAELVREIEEEDRKLMVEYFDIACQYKSGWEEAIERAKLHGTPIPEPIPHPDDVIIDVRRGDVHYAGPMTKEEKLAWDKLLEFRDEQQEEVTFLAETYERHAAEKNPPLQVMGGIAKSWRQATIFYDRVNDPLPDRYRRKLQDRFSEARLIDHSEEDAE